MNLYLDASALVKRYIAEPGSDLVRDAMQQAGGWFICRVAFVETVRAVELAAGQAPARAFREEWSAFAVVEVDQRLVEEAARLAIRRDLGSLDSLHLAAALLLPRDDLVFATWDQRLHAGALAEGLQALPAALA